MMGTGEEIRIGQLAIRFLLEGHASGGSVAVFEVDVPVGAKLPIAHSHDGYEETIYGIEGVLTWMVDRRARDVARTRCSVYLAARSTASTTIVRPTRKYSRS